MDWMRSKLEPSRNQRGQFPENGNFMQRRVIRRPAQHRQRSGAVTVEMALVTPILLILAFGVIQVGYAFMVQHVIQNAACEGCRVAILPSRSTSAVSTAISKVLQQPGLNQVATTRIQVNNVDANVENAVSSDMITVQVTIALSDVTLFPGFFSGWDGTLKGAVTLRCQ